MGVWRTVGGRKIYIEKGQSLADAMKSSGKFGKDKKDGKDDKKEGKEKRTSLTEKEVRKIYKEEDYTEVIDSLHPATRQKLEHAYKDMEFYKTVNQDVAKSIQEYIDKTEAEAALKWYNKNLK